MTGGGRANYRFLLRRLVVTGRVGLVVSVGGWR